MTFVYEVENEDGEVVARYGVEATFAGEEPGFFSGRPEKCRPDTGGELIWTRSIDAAKGNSRRSIFQTFSLSDPIQHHVRIIPW